MESRHLTSEQLSASLDRQLSGAEQRRVDAHLGSCPECQRELAQLQQTIGLLRALPSAVPPRAFRVTESARVAPVAPRWWAQPIWLRSLGSAAAALMVMVLAVDAVLPTMQVETAATRGVPSASAPAASQFAGTPGAAGDPAASSPAPRALERASEDAASRSIAPLAGGAAAQRPAEPPVMQDAAKAEGAPQAFAESQQTGGSEPEVSSTIRAGHVVGAVLGVLAAVFLGASLVARRRRA